MFYEYQECLLRFPALLSWQLDKGGRAAGLPKCKIRLRRFCRGGQGVFNSLSEVAKQRRQCLFQYEGKITSFCFVYLHIQMSSLHFFKECLRCLHSTPSRYSVGKRTRRNRILSHLQLGTSSGCLANLFLAVPKGFALRWLTWAYGENINRACPVLYVVVLYPRILICLYRVVMPGYFCRKIFFVKEVQSKDDFMASGFFWRRRSFKNELLDTFIIHLEHGQVYATKLILHREGAGPHSGFAT